MLEHMMVRTPVRCFGIDAQERLSLGPAVEIVGARRELLWTIGRRLSRPARGDFRNGNRRRRGGRTGHWSTRHVVFGCEPIASACCIKFISALRTGCGTREPLFVMRATLSRPSGAQCNGALAW